MAQAAAVEQLRFVSSVTGASPPCPMLVAQAWEGGWDGMHARATNPTSLLGPIHSFTVLAAISPFRSHSSIGILSPFPVLMHLPVSTWMCTSKITGTDPNRPTAAYPQAKEQMSTWRRPLGLPTPLQDVVCTLVVQVHWLWGLDRIGQSAQ